MTPNTAVLALLAAMISTATAGPNDNIVIGGIDITAAFSSFAPCTINCFKKIPGFKNVAPYGCDIYNICKGDNAAALLTQCIPATQCLTDAASLQLLPNMCIAATANPQICNSTTDSTTILPGVTTSSKLHTTTTLEIYPSNAASMISKAAADANEKTDSPSSSPQTTTGFRNEALKLMSQSRMLVALSAVLCIFIIF